MSELSEKQIEKIKKSFPKTIGKRIKDIRNIRGFTQTELANLTGKDRQYIYKIEKGIVTINIVTLYIITYALETTIEDFFKDL